MLILQRKKNQELMIGDEIRLSVVDIGSDWVKLAIDAPREVSILRSELVEAASENKEACGSLTGHSLEGLKKLLEAKKEGQD